MPQNNFLYNEKELLLLTSQGDTGAFSIIYNAYRNKTFGYISGLVKSQVLAEDIFQDVFTRIWEQRSALAQIDNFNAYLFAVIRNRTFDGMRRVAKEHEIIREMNFNSPHSFSGTDETLQYHEVQKKLHLAVRRLPEQQRQVYLLGKEEGLKHEEIALKLNIAITTVNKHMTRALGFLRKSLGALLWLVS